LDKTKILHLLNNGGQDELIALPGIGPVLANRLIEARPFDTLDSVQAVKGIGANLLDRISEVVLEAEAQPSEEAADRPASESQPVDAASAESDLLVIQAPIEEKSETLKPILLGPVETIDQAEQATPEPVDAAPAESDLPVIHEPIEEKSETIKAALPDLEETVDEPEQAALEPVDAAPAESDLPVIHEPIEEKSQAIKAALPDLEETVDQPEQAALEPVDAAPAESDLPVIHEPIEEKSETIKAGLSSPEKTADKAGQAAPQPADTPPQKSAQAPKPRVSRWTLLFSSLFTALIAVLLTLAVIGGINGSLKFTTSTQFLTMQREVGQLAARADTLQQDLDGLRGRVDMLEGLADRTVALEKAQEQLVADQETTNQQVTALQTELDALSEEIALQGERTQRFETFLKDLQTVLGNLFAPQGDTP
jgi:hypothetical protein